MLPSPHIVVVFGVPLLFLLSFAAGRSSVKLVPRRPVLGPARRPGFWITRVASLGGNPAAEPPAETYTACKPAGSKPAGAVLRLMPPPRNSFIEPGSYIGGPWLTSVTGGYRGPDEPDNIAG